MFKKNSRVSISQFLESLLKNYLVEQDLFKNCAVSLLKPYCNGKYHAIFCYNIHIGLHWLLEVLSFNLTIIGCTLEAREIKQQSHDWSN